MEKTCVNCQQPFEGRPDQRYCHNRCKTRHHRARQQNTPSSVSGITPGNSPVRFNDPAKSEIEMGINLEIKKLELEHEERIKLLDMQVDERLRQQEAEDRERQNQHDFDLAELSALNDLARAKEQLAQLKAEKEAQRERADRAERKSLNQVPDKQGEEEQAEPDEGGLWKLGAIGMGAVLLMNLLSDKKPVPPQRNPPPKPTPKLGTL